MAPLRKYLAYAFILAGVAWLAVAVLAGSALILWPTGVCIVSGLALRMRPEGRLTWAWVMSSAVLGFLIAAYQLYAWSSYLGGTFSTLAASAFAGFAVFAVVHALLFVVAAKPASSDMTAATGS
jgi:hypothetical protein